MRSVSCSIVACCRRSVWDPPNARSCRGARGTRAKARAGNYVSHYGFAVIQAGLGNTEEAFNELELAYEERSAWMLMLKQESAFDGLRGDRRFAALLRRIGLPS